MINHFSIKSTGYKEWYLVDLPGYGYAKRSMKMRKSFGKMIENYITKRENLAYLFVLIDSRIPPQEIDIEFVNQLGEWQVAFGLVFTKTDKTTQRETAKNVQSFLSVLAQSWEEPPPYFLTSAIKRTGAKQILATISAANEDFETFKKNRV